MQVTMLGLILFQSQQDWRDCVGRTRLWGLASRFVHHECDLILQLDSCDALKPSRARQVKDWSVLTVP